MPNDASKDDKQVVSTADLAAKLGLSRWAVSRALNGRGGVSKATVARVRSALREHHFEPDLLARGLRGGSTGLVGICLPRSLWDTTISSDQGGLHPETLSKAMSMMYKQLEDRSLNAIQAVAGSAGQEGEVIRRLLGLRVDALVLIAPQLDSRSPEARSVFDAKTPCIAVNPINELPCATLRFDRPQAARLVISHLHKIGHKRLALLGMHPQGKQARAFETACAATDISWRSHVRVMHRDDLQTSPIGGLAFGWALADGILRRNAAATALIAADDHIAAGVLARLRHEGKSVPRDFAVIGHGNFEFGAYADPPLTTVDPQATRMFEHAAETLCEQISTRGRIETQEILINPLFLNRSSTGLPPSGPGSIAAARLIALANRIQRGNQQG